MTGEQTARIEGGAGGGRFGIVASRFNGRFVESLLEGALECLDQHGLTASDIHIVRVPGAWEVPLALEALARTGGYRGLVALAVVVRGETAHFDYICRECSRGVSEVMTRYRLPVGFGVLTCDTVEQAEARAGGARGNKGWEAAAAALEMGSLLQELDLPSPAGAGAKKQS